MQSLASPSWRGEIPRCHKTALFLLIYKFIIFESFVYHRYFQYDDVIRIYQLRWRKKYKTLINTLATHEELPFDDKLLRGKFDHNLS